MLLKTRVSSSSSVNRGGSALNPSVEEDALRVRRVAVGVLPAARRDDDRLIEVAVAIKEPDEDIRAVDLRVDIEVSPAPCRTIGDIRGLSWYFR